MSIISLWQPILASAVIVFFASAAIWTVLPWHKTDWRKTQDEEGVRSALKGLSPGQYSVPYCTDASGLNEPEMQQKFKDGPVAYITVAPSGLLEMGPKMAMMFAYTVLIGIVCAYVVSRTAAPDAEYLTIFRISGTVAFVAYGMAFVQDSVWFGRPWSTTLKTFLDALIYSLLTGGVFGWLS